MRLRKIIYLPLLAPILIHAQSAEQTQFFETKIRPIFATSCANCHGDKTKMAGLDLTTAATFAKGGDSGPIVSKDSPEDSKLLAAVGYLGSIIMPPTVKL